MKIRKTAQQQNFHIDTSCYTEWKLNILLEEGTIHDLNKDHPGSSIDDEPVYVIYAQECKEVKVACIDGYYSTVVVLPDNSTLFISL